MEGSRGQEADLLVCLFVWPLCLLTSYPARGAGGLARRAASLVGDVARQSGSSIAGARVKLTGSAEYVGTYMIHWPAASWGVAHARSPRARQGDTFPCPACQSAIKV